MNALNHVWRSAFWQVGERLRRRQLLGAGVLMGALPWHMAWGAGDPTEGDPLGSTQWPDIQRAFVGAGPVRFSGQVSVKGPAFADDALNVPVMVDARALASAGAAVARIRVVVDRNPIRHVLDYEPLLSLPVLAFRLRLEQASPVRALVQTQDGRWHAGGTWVQAAGGGCTVPGATRADGSWSQTLNQVQARFFSSVLEGSRRLRVRIMHPMDTGLVAGIPAFHLEQLELLDATDRPCWRLVLHEPVSENPLITFELPRQLTGHFRLVGRDNNGNRIDAAVPA
ncbi:quinoprotein dehydrogenase-associated SoxYZ-like carrier [Hydrogenophaga laconesensis]|uniref:Sulfur-oxidizing protein SoxY n=1 Tax=Hydrogenophaga laconesensis TaxID=1805971 RepID=A0ABU1VEY4_9BURK|nr:quinoprotein dehydrogenase-associated SoxYZ-like carrier [Hydrogenophaga laconesensis]MDR7095758.1 sulfur-oxidizing protein SoxY [Hydrogenophaga laconesensis]